MIQCQVVTAVPKFAYVTNSASNTVSAYTIGAASGVLTYQGTAQTGSKPYSVTVEPGGRFAYVANLDSHTISAYSIDASSGVLTAIDANGIVAGTTIATGTGPISVTVHPSGKFAYVVNGVAGSALSGDSISAYSINVTTGALSAIDADGAPGTQATIATGSEPKAIAIDPTGQFAYVANYGSGTASHTVSAYTLDQTTGALTYVVSYTPGTGPTSIAIDPTGKFAYVANSTSDDVSAYTISASGVLTAAASGAIAAETAPRSVAVADTGSGMYAYVANAGSGTVSAYTIGASGVLTALTAGASAVAGATPVSVNVDPSGQFVYVANFDSNNVSVYSIGASGVLTAAASAVATEGRPTSVTTTQ